jgi:hypothetical protein
MALWVSLQRVRAGGTRLPRGQQLAAEGRVGAAHVSLIASSASGADDARCPGPGRPDRSWVGEEILLACGVEVGHGAVGSWSAIRIRLITAVRLAAWAMTSAACGVSGLGDGVRRPMLGSQCGRRRGPWRRRPGRPRGWQGWPGQGRYRGRGRPRRWWSSALDVDRSVCALSRAVIVPDRDLLSPPGLCLDWSRMMV